MRATAASWVCFDEIQRYPALLNEVHRFIEERALRFVLLGSSAQLLPHILEQALRFVRVRGSTPFERRRIRYNRRDRMNGRLLVENDEGKFFFVATRRGPRAQWAHGDINGPGLSPDRDCEAMGRLVRDNLHAHFSGQPLLTPV